MTGPQQTRRSYNADEALHFLFDSEDEDQGNVLHDTNTSASESKTKKVI